MLVRAADLIFPGEYPFWVNFQTTKCSSLYLVSLPHNITESDLFGLELFMCFDYVWPPTKQHKVMDGGIDYIMCFNFGDDIVHTMFLYIPRKPLSSNRHGYSITELNWSNLTLEFPGMEIRSKSKVSRMTRCGLRLLCRRERDDLQQIEVRKDARMVRGD